MRSKVSLRISPTSNTKRNPRDMCVLLITANCGNISLVPYPLITISVLTATSHHSITSLHVPYGFANSYIKSIHLRNEINLIVLLPLSVFIFLITLFVFLFTYPFSTLYIEKGFEKKRKVMSFTVF